MGDVRTGEPGAESNNGILQLCVYSYLSLVVHRLHDRIGLPGSSDDRQNRPKNKKKKKRRFQTGMIKEYPRKGNAKYFCLTGVEEPPREGPSLPPRNPLSYDRLSSRNWYRFPLLATPRAGRRAASRLL